MNKEGYIKIKTNSILDIEETANKYDMLPEEFVAYHNNYCGISDVLSLKLPIFIEYLYVPKYKYDRRQEKLLNNNTLSFPKNQSDKEYGIIINFFPKELQIHYRINVKREQQKVKLVKDKTFVDNNEIDKVIEKLYEKAEKALYPLELSINLDGSINNVINTKKIEKRWEEDILPKLQQYYQSEISDKLISQLNYSFLHLGNKTDLLKHSLFYKFFFMPVYRSYPKFELKAILPLYFSMLDRDISYETKCTLNQEYTKSGKVALRIEGNEEENIFNTGKEKGKIDFLYKFHKETEELFSIAGFFTAFENGKEYKTEFQLYELKSTTL